MDLDKIIKKEGLALDVDETLSITCPQIFSDLAELFGLPNGVPIEELLKEHTFAGRVPGWDKGEPFEWIKNQFHDMEYSKTFKTIDGALEYVHEVNKIVPICAYITARPYTLQTPTEEWIKDKGFPDAPIITRHDMLEGAGSRWKAPLLERVWPKVYGIVDDNKKLIQYFTDYQGTLFLFEKEEAPESKFDVVPCKDWEATYKAIKERF